MTPAEQATALVSKAGEDIHVLVVLRDDAATTDAIWGFHAQQAVEKLLKAMLAVHGQTFPFTHRLLQLADLLDDARIPFDPRFESLLDLTPYAVEMRYSTLSAGPNEPKLDRADTLAKIVALRLHVQSVIATKRHP